MAETNRYANLPGYDQQQEIYETPELTDDTSTSTNQRSPSPAISSATSDEDGDESYGVSRRRLYPERARSRFDRTDKRVETKGVDLSDRVDGRRRGYGVKKARGVREEDEDEGLKTRIARLKREIEECRVLAKEGDQADAGAGGEAAEDEINSMSRMLAGIEVEGKEKEQKARQPAENEQETAAPDAREEEDLTDDQILQRVSAFDTRLASLETALGIQSLDAAIGDSDGSTAATPLLPTLSLLDQQLSAITSATSLTNLEAVGGRVRKYTEELAAARNQGLPQQVASEDGDGTPATAVLSPEDYQHLQSLYPLLPTLQNLSPTVPPLLARLRSLRQLHSTAASAAEDLDALETRQTEMEQELKTWRQGLEKVEQVVGRADEANGRNGMVVEGWVKDLEKRVRALGGR